MEQHYYKLIDDYFKKKISSDNLADLMSWVASNSENQQTFRAVLKTYEIAEKALTTPFNQQKSWLTIQQHISKQKVVSSSKFKINNKFWLQVAAAIIVLLSISALYINSTKREAKVETAFFEIYNPKGQKRLIAMPDGSNIYLNGDSKIRYAKNFNSGKRIIFLEGEAFFDVQHRSKQPFIVHTGKISTSVLGTSFNINAYQNFDKISITVKTGRVGVVINDSIKKQVHFLLPNEQLNVAKDLSALKKVTDADEVDSWREYKMVFHNQQLSDIAKVIEREYDIDVEIETKSLAKVQLTTKFNRSSLKEIMDMLSQLSNAHYKIYPKKVIIY